MRLSDAAQAFGRGDFAAAAAPGGERGEGSSRPDGARRPGPSVLRQPPPPSPAVRACAESLQKVRASSSSSSPPPPRAQKRGTVAFLRAASTKLVRGESPSMTSPRGTMTTASLRKLVQRAIMRAMLRTTQGKCQRSFGVWRRAYLDAIRAERPAPACAASLLGDDDDEALLLGEHRIPWYMISSQTKFSVAWQIWNAIMLVYIMFMIPLSWAFLSDPSVRSWRYAVERIVDFCFVYDITVNFRTGFFLTEHSHEILQPRRCAKRYLQSWFLLDFCASAPPVIEMGMYLVSGGADGDLASLKVLRVLKLGRVLRIFKVFKVSDMLDSDSAVGEAVETFFTSTASQFVAQTATLLLIATIVSHLLACCMIMSGADCPGGAFLSPRRRLRERRVVVDPSRRGEYGSARRRRLARQVRLPQRARRGPPVRRRRRPAPRLRTYRVRRRARVGQTVFDRDVPEAASKSLHHCDEARLWAELWTPGGATAYRRENLGERDEARPGRFLRRTSKRSTVPRSRTPK